MIKKNIKGYTLVELIAGVAIFSIISIVTFNSLKVMRDNHSIEENEASIDLREIMKQEFLLEGIHPEDFLNPIARYGDVDATIKQVDSQLNAGGKNGISLLSVNFQEDRARINVIGKVI